MRGGLVGQMHARFMRHFFCSSLSMYRVCFLKKVCSYHLLPCFGKNCMTSSLNYITKLPRAVQQPLKSIYIALSYSELS